MGFVPPLDIFGPRKIQQGLHGLAVFASTDSRVVWHYDVFFEAWSPKHKKNLNGTSLSPKPSVRIEEACMC